MDGGRKALPDNCMTDSSPMSPFKKASECLWDQHVVQDMTYGQGLLFCKGCLSGFYEMAKSTHPKDAVVPFASYCVKEQLSTAQAFHDHLWKLAIKLQPIYGRILIPQLNVLHAEPLVNFKGSEISEPLQQARTKVAILEEELRKHIEGEQKLSRELDEENRKVDILMERCIKEKSYNERVKLAATYHIEALYNLLHPEGCGCTNGCGMAPLKPP